jgi:hypothetical protein
MTSLSPKDSGPRMLAMVLRNVRDIRGRAQNSYSTTWNAIWRARAGKRATLPGFAARPLVQTRLPPSSFTDDKLRDLDVICRIITPIHAVPDLVNKFVFSWTALAFNNDGIGSFQGVSYKDVDNFPHQHTPPISGHRTVPPAVRCPNRSKMQRRVKEEASSNLRDRMSMHRNETVTSVESWMSRKVIRAGRAGSDRANSGKIAVVRNNTPPASGLGNQGNTLTNDARRPLVCPL